MTLHWKDLDPDHALLAALDAAGPRPESGSSDKRNWGKRFADSCAVMIADAMRAESTFAGLEIRPNEDGSGQESLTGVGGRGTKKVDVIASTLASGLQVAVSLKAENFAWQGTFGKNLTNRLYELQDEVRAIHEYQPKAYVVGVFFLPTWASMDRPDRSSFARTVAKLRARTGRLDSGLSSHLNRLDWSVVALYQAEDDELDIRRGVVRYFDVRTAPPASGRPKVNTTIDLASAINKIARDYARDAGEIFEYADPEPD